MNLDVIFILLQPSLLLKGSIAAFDFDGVSYKLQKS